MTTMLEKYVAKEYGVAVTTTNPGLIASVGTSVAQIFRRNSNRIMALIINLSGNTVYVGFDGNVSTTNGILLDPAGGQISTWIKEDASLTQEEIWVVANGAGSALYAIELEGIR